MTVQQRPTPCADGRIQCVSKHTAWKKHEIFTARQCLSYSTRRTPCTYILNPEILSLAHDGADRWVSPVMLGAPLGTKRTNWPKSLATNLKLAKSKIGQTVLMWTMLGRQKGRKSGAPEKTEKLVLSSYRVPKVRTVHPSWNFLREP